MTIRKTKSKRKKAKAARKSRLERKKEILLANQTADWLSKLPEKWTPFCKCVTPTRVEAETIIRRESSGHYTEEELEADDLLKNLVDDMVNCRIFKNSQYTVTKYPPQQVAGWPCGVIHLSIKRNDRAAINSWSDMQRIKNEIVGPFHEGVELFPSEHRLVNCANQYHIFVLEEPLQFPFGFNERKVMPQAEGSKAKQDLEETFNYDDYKGAAE